MSFRLFLLAFLILGLSFDEQVGAHERAAAKAADLSYATSVTGQGLQTDFVLPGLNENTAGIGQWLDVKLRTVGCSVDGHAEAYLAFNMRPDAWHRFLPYSSSWDANTRMAHWLYGPLSREEIFDAATGDFIELPLYLSVETPNANCRFELFADLYSIRVASLGSWSAPLGFADVARQYGASQIIFEIPLDYLSTNELLTVQARFSNSQSCGTLSDQRLPVLYLSRSTLYSSATIATLDDTSRMPIHPDQTNLVVSSLSQFDITGSSAELWFAGILPPTDVDLSCAHFQVIFDLVAHAVLTPRHTNVTLYLEQQVWSYATYLASDTTANTLVFDFYFWPTAVLEVFWAFGRFPTALDSDGRSGEIDQFSVDGLPSYSKNFTVGRQDLHIGFLLLNPTAYVEIVTYVAASRPLPSGEDHHSSGGPSAGVVIAIVLGVIAFVAIIVSVVLVIYVRRRRFAAATAHAGPSSGMDFLTAENPAGNSYSRLRVQEEDDTDAESE